MTKPSMCILWAGLFLLFSPTLTFGLGVNWGIQASHPLPPKTVVEMLKANSIPKVKLFDSNSSVMQALSGSNIEVMVGIPNDLLSTLNDPAQATSWVKNNVVQYLGPSGVDIRYVAVGNEPFLKSYNNSYISTTYPALVNIQTALNAANVGSRIKATVPMNADVIDGASAPSQSTFRAEIKAVMTQIVASLQNNNAPYTINIYPFISLIDDPNFPEDYAFFGGTSHSVSDPTLSLTYTNVFDASYDSLVAALQDVGYGSMNIIVGEIGWPTDGNFSANVSNAVKFNQGFLTHVSGNNGTPRHPNSPIDFYLFSLIDEDLKSVEPGDFERHWGIFAYDGKPKYALSGIGSNGPKLAGAVGVEYLTREWCVYNGKASDPEKLGQSITYACENSDCTSLGYGSSCNLYLDANQNVSYAFNEYFQRFDQGLGTCDFGGLGEVVTTDPSVGNCGFIIQIAVGQSSSGDQNGWSWIVGVFSFTLVMLGLSPFSVCSCLERMMVF